MLKYKLVRHILNKQNLKNQRFPFVFQMIFITKSLIRCLIL